MSEILIKTEPIVPLTDRLTKTDSLRHPEVSVSGVKFAFITHSGYCFDHSTT